MRRADASTKLGVVLDVRSKRGFLMLTLQAWDVGCSRDVGWGMDTRKLAKLLLIGGGLLLVASFVWWWMFYDEVRRFVGGRQGSTFEAISCLYSTSGPCSLVSGMASAGGATPYSPVIFWIAAASVVLGGLIWLSQSKERG